MNSGEHAKWQANRLTLSAWLFSASNAQSSRHGLNKPARPTGKVSIRSLAKATADAFGTSESIPITRLPYRNSATFCTASQRDPGNTPLLSGCPFLVRDKRWRVQEC